MLATSGIPLPFSFAWRFLLGLAFAIGLQFTEGGFRGDPWGTGWWLDDWRRVVTGFVGAGVLGLLTVNSHDHVIALELGIMTGMTGVLVWLGLGNIWPIVLAFAAILTGSAIYIAWEARWTLTEWWAHKKGGPERPP